jgi:uncharacterized repeat protein (TIGR03803 family)
MHNKGRFPNVILGARLQPEGVTLAIVLTLLGLIFVFLFMTLTAQLAQGQSAQNVVPPTARQAAASPEWAPRLARPSTPQAASKSPASAGTWTRQASPLDGVIYSNGPVNGTVDAWTINFGYVVSDSFPVAAGQAVGGFDFYVWAYPGDTPLTVDWSITSEPLGGGTVYGSGTASVTSTFISSNQYGYDIDLATVTGLNVSLGAGTYFLNLQKAVTSFGDPLFWDENSGPSQAYTNSVGSIPSEAFDVTGNGGLYSACDPYSQDSVRTQPTGSLNLIYLFTGGADGKFPNAATVDHAGNVYGTTTSGTAFKLSNPGSGWVLNTLYNFPGSVAARTLGPEGALYGWAASGTPCTGNGCVFNLKPPPTAARSVMAPWLAIEVYPLESTLPQGPGYDFAFDSAGNLYGSSVEGGEYGFGMVYKLTPSGSTWAMTVLYSFRGGADGESPRPVIIDKSGNLYGTSGGGAYGYGTVFQLTPSGGEWGKKTLYDFTGVGYDGYSPTTLVVDAAGNLYGGTQYGDYGPSIFQLTPSGQGWRFNIIWRLVHLKNYGPIDRPAIDAAGNLYFTHTDSCGSTRPDGSCDLPLSNYSEVFELTPSESGWHCSVLFSRENARSLSLDDRGNLYGTTDYGGSFGAILQYTP